MWMTPMMTDIFILYELRKVSLLLAIPQTWRGHKENRIKQKAKILESWQKGGWAWWTYWVDAKWIGATENTRHSRIHGQVLVPGQHRRTKKRRRRCEIKTEVETLWIIFTIVSLFSLPYVLLKHRLDSPRRAEGVEASAEALVVNGPRVDGKQTHQQNQISSSKHHLPDLKRTDLLVISLFQGQDMFHLVCFTAYRQRRPFILSTYLNVRSRVCLEALWEVFVWSTSLLLLLSLGSLSSRIIHRAARAISKPWPTSPNITANRKGNVIIVYTAARALREQKRTHDA